MLGLGINLQSWRHHLNQCTAETKEILKVEDSDCCIFVLIENKIKSVEFDVWSRSDPIQVVQSLSKAGGAENEACRSETFEVWREKGKCVLFLSKIFCWLHEIARYDTLISCLVQRWFSISSTVYCLNRMAEGLHCVWICFEKFTIWPEQFQLCSSTRIVNRHDINLSRHCFCSLGVFSPSIPWALRCGVVWERGSRAENYCKLINATDKKRYF